MSLLVNQSWIALKHIGLVFFKCIYLHTGLDNSEFGECNYAYRKTFTMPFIVTAYNMQLCALQVTNRALYHTKTHVFAHF